MKINVKVTSSATGKQPNASAKAKVTRKPKKSGGK